MSEPFSQQNVPGSYNAVAKDGSTATVNNAVYQFGDPAQVDPIRLDDALALLEQMPVDTIPAVSSLPTGSRPGFAHNPLFVGREEDLKNLARALKAGGTAAIGQIAAATGLGGIGKTQLASEFVHRYGRFFAGGVFWLSFATPEGIPTEIAACSPPPERVLDQDVRIARVRASWDNPLPRLLVFDNCEDEELLAAWRPKTGGSRVLITSRCSEWSPDLGVQAFSLGVLSRTESIDLLRKLCPAMSTDEADAIAAELGDLPLALHLAGSFLQTYRASVTAAQYLEQIRSVSTLQHLSLQGHGVKRSPTGHEVHVGRTFAVSYDRLDPNNPTDVLAQTLLQCASWLAAGEPIPRHLLAKVLHPAGDQADPIQAEDALGRLVRLGLLEEQDDRRLVIHRLLAEFVHGQPGAGTALGRVERRLLEAAGPLIAAADRRPIVSWLPHFRAVTMRAGERTDRLAATLYGTLGQQLHLLAAYGEAYALLVRGVTIRKEVSGPRHRDTAISLNNLASLLYAQGKLAEAEPLFREALDIRKEVLGARHRKTANSLNGMASLLQAQGKEAEAEPLYREALDIFKEVLGPRHPDTANSLNNLAFLLRALGKLADAEPLFREALDIRKEVLGPRHPSTATSLNNLASLLNAQGKEVEAEPLYREALDIFKEALGPRHPDTAASLNNLAVLLQAQGKLAEAEPLYREALDIRKEVLGPRHPHTGNSLNSVGFLLEAQGKLAEAEPLYREALQIYTEALGCDHPTTGIIRRNLEHLQRSRK